LATRNVTGTASGVTVFSATVPLPHGFVIGTAVGATDFRISAVIAIPPALPARVGLQRLVGNAKVEIRTHIGTGGADVDVWTDIACQVVSARSSWGTQKSVGILSQANPGTLELEIYDPDRLLDPSNSAGPYYGILLPWLWVRLVFDNGVKRIVIKSGYADSITHTISTKMGSIRINDWLTLLANMGYPNEFLAQDTLLQYSTLHTFTTGILSAAWSPTFVLGGGTAGSPVSLPVTVEAETTPIPIDVYTHTISLGQVGPAVWGWITERSIAALYYAYMDAANVIHFRDSTYGHQPGIALGVSGPLPLDLITQIDASGVSNSIYVVVGSAAAVWGGFDNESKRSAFQWGVKQYTSPRIPPKPPGLYTANEWAVLVRNDRNQPAFEALPVRIWPASVAEFEQLLGLEAMQLVVMQFDSVTPPISIYGRAIGQVVNVDDDGWSVELSTWIPR
jgi:hypothetical protein